MHQATKDPVNRRQRGAPVLKFFAAAGALFALLMMFPYASRAQLVTGDILGTVTDSTGAVVPNAKVTILNSGTGIAASVQSDSAGEFLFSKVQIGSYKVTVEAKGFKTFTTVGVPVTASDRIRVTAKMEVGSQVETVQVEASEAVELKTDSSDLGAMISSNSLTDMPTNGRNYYDLMGYSAGNTQASETNDPRTGSRPSMAFSANGQSSTFNNNMIDGMDNNQRSVGLVNVEPSLDALQEVQVETSNYSAEYSRTGGGIANLITKSGTNQYHGTLFEFMRNDAFDAYPWTTGTKTKTELRQNQYGGSLGGPILKNKAFFFGDYQGWRHISGALGKALVPTVAEYNSIHAYATGSANTITLQDPWDAYGGAQAFVIGPGATTAYRTGSTTQLASLQANIDPLGLAYAMETPRPQCDSSLGGNASDTCDGVIAPGGADTGTYNYQRASNAVQDTDTYDGRVDYHFNDYNTLFGRYSYSHTTNVNGNSSVLPPVAIVNGDSKLYYPGENSGIVTSQNVALDWVHIFSPTTVFEAKASYAQSFFTGYSGGRSWDLTEVGEPTSADFSYNTSGVVGLPFMSFYGSSAPMGSTYAGAVASPFSSISGDPGMSYFTENTFQYSASLTENKKAHSIKMGVALIRRQIKNPETSNSTQTYATNYTPNALGDMLAGEAVELAGSKVMITPHFRMWEPSAYFQDDWRVTKALTLNLGVRYDIYTPFTEHDGGMSNFDMNTDLIVSPTLLGANHGSSTAGIATDLSDVSPRVGFAWSLPGNNVVTKSMVLRGGFGMSYFPGNTGGSMLEWSMTNNPFIWSMSCGNGNYGMGLIGCNTPSLAYASAGLADGGYNVSDNLPAAVYQTSTATDPYQYASEFSSDKWVAPNFKSLYLEQFNLQLQKQMGNNLFTAGFVGNLSRHLPVSQNFNQPTNTQPTVYPMSSAAAPWMNNTPVSMSFSGANASWMAGEATYERRLTHGFSVNANYTWSRATSQGTGASDCVNIVKVAGDTCTMDDGSGGTTLVSDWREYNYTGSTTHRLAGMVSYNVPTRAEWKQGVLGAITNGWTLNGTGYWNTGAWNPISSGVNRSGITAGTEYASRVPGSSLNPAGGRTFAEWFNIATFELQPAGTLGNANGNANYVQGPRTRDSDLSFGKTFSVYEGFKLQFRAEAFNLTNTPNYDPPPGPPPGGGGPGGGGGGMYSVSVFCNPTNTAQCTNNSPPGTDFTGWVGASASGSGVINSVSNSSRIFQFGLKLIY